MLVAYIGLWLVALALAVVVFVATVRLGIARTDATANPILRSLLDFRTGSPWWSLGYVIAIAVAAWVEVPPAVARGTVYPSDLFLPGILLAAVGIVAVGTLAYARSEMDNRQASRARRTR